MYRLCIVHVMYRLCTEYVYIMHMYRVCIGYVRVMYNGMYMLCTRYV